MSATCDLTKQLIACDSVTPQDSGCQQLIANYLKKAGFSATPLPFGEVENLWLRKGKELPLFVFAGHTDVVPPGSLDKWRYPPFTPTIQDGYLYGRGAADMKSSIAAMAVACQRFATQYPQHRGSIALLITSDEEGPAINGTAKVLTALQENKEALTWCLVGEPSCVNKLGDTIKRGRRGSLSGELKIIGKQGHVAYPHLAKNPIHLSASILEQLVNTTWDNGNEQFPPTTFQISNINAGTGAENVIPEDIIIRFNFRFSIAITVEELKRRVEKIIKDHKVNYELTWIVGGLPFITEPGDLLEACKTSIREMTGVEPQLSTSGGTSDGRFIAQVCPQVIEFGPINATIHQINECINVDDLETLTKIYFRILEKLLT